MCGDKCGCKSQVVVKFKRLNELAEMPKYQTEGAAGFDLAAAERRVVFPGGVIVVKTGLACEIPPGYEMQIRPRSGLSLKSPLLVKNAPGTIDCDYRGEVGIILMNVDDANVVGNRPYVIEVGDRIAQGVINAVPAVQLVEAVELSDTARGEGGFGHTGVGA